jgi:hypothetical protein
MVTGIRQKKGPASVSPAGFDFVSNQTTQPRRDCELVHVSPAPFGAGCAARRTMQMTRHRMPDWLQIDVVIIVAAIAIIAAGIWIAP